MTIKDIEFKLKDGRTAILRSANEKDAKAFIEYMKKSTGETDFLLRTPEEVIRTAREGFYVVS